MQFREMKITVVSAKGLKRVKHLSKMDVYVLVSLTGGHEIEKKTPVDEGSGPNPNWNFPMSFNVAADGGGHLSLRFRVMCRRRVHSDKDIGEVTVPMKELLENGGDGRYVKYVTYELRKPNGKHRGKLNLTYEFAAQPLEVSSSVKLNGPPAAAMYPPPAAGQYFPALPPTVGFGLGLPMGYIPVYGNGTQVGFGPTQPRPPYGNGEDDAAFVSGVLGGLMIEETLNNAASHGP